MTSKISKALKKIERFLDSSQRKQRKKRKDIMDKLKLLRQRVKAIKRKLDNGVSEEKKKMLKSELSLIKAKRRKAIDILKDMRRKG